jgi:predicted DNA-binding transcriptional regulator AlpA
MINPTSPDPLPRERTLIRINDVASMLGVKPATVRDYLERIPEFPEPLRIGASLFWIKQDMEEYIDSLEREAAERSAERRAMAA